MTFGFIIFSFFLKTFEEETFFILLDYLVFWVGAELAYVHPLSSVFLSFVTTGCWYMTPFSSTTRFISNQVLWSMMKTSLKILQTHLIFIYFPIISKSTVITNHKAQN